MNAVVKHGERAHAALGASAAHRWMNCPGSIRLSAGIPSTSSIYADEGTAAHELCEKCLLQEANAEDFLGDTITVNGTDFEVDQEMVDAVAVYCDTVWGAMSKSDILMIEERFSLESLDPPAPMFGTADAVIYKPKRGKRPARLVVIDFKYGQGVPVEVLGNPQMRYYGLGAALKHRDKPLSVIEMVVVQPRARHADGPVRREEIPVFELIEWSGDLLEAARRTEDPDAPLAAGDWCRFCPAHPVCPEARRAVLETAKADFADVMPPEPETLTAEQIGEILNRGEIIKKWIASVYDYALAELNAGREIPGWKLVDKRATRKWMDEQAAIEKLRDLGLDDDDLYTSKFVTPAQAEKKLGKGQKGEIAGLIIKESSGVTLAPEFDARPPAIPAAQRDFAGLFED